MSFTTARDLSQKVYNLYQRIDVDESGAIDLQEFNEGMKKLSITPAIRLTSDDWDVMTEKGTLLNSEGELTAPSFEKMLLGQIASFTRRKVVSAMQRIENDVEGELMFALKMLMGTVDQVYVCACVCARVCVHACVRLFVCG